MAGPLRRGEQQVSWASRTESSTSPRSASGLQRETIVEESTPAHSQAVDQVLSPTRQVDNSPDVFSPDGRPGVRSQIKSNSAPSKFGHYQRFSPSTLSSKFSLDRVLRSKAMGSVTGLSQDFELDVEAPQKAVRDGHSIDDGSTGSKLHVVEELEQKGGEVDEHQAPADNAATWGDSFKVEWVCMEKLPFQRTRHLRNPWNHDKEIKVSRDGTELEPIVGRQLLEEWAKYVQEVASGELKPTTGDSKIRMAAG